MPSQIEPVYEPTQTGDLGELQSYVVTLTRRTQRGTDQSESEGLRVLQGTLAVVNAPFRAALTLSTSQSNVAGEVDLQDTSHWYQQGDVAYQQFQEGSDGWSIQFRNKSYLNWLIADISHIKTARFAGRVDLQGMPTNRFIFDQTGWVSDPLSGQQTIDSVQGSIYLAEEGNYPLHLDYTIVGNVWRSDVDTGMYLPGIMEVAYDVSSIGQVADLVLPEDAPLELDFANIDVPLPADAKLSDVMVFEHKPPYNYSFTTDQTDDEFIGFYQAPSIDTWTVSAAMKDPDGDGATVILMRNGQSVILSIRTDRYASKRTISFQYSP